MSDVSPIYETVKGEMYCGASESLLSQSPMTEEKGNVQLIFTSPPFPLNRKKAYGNLEGEEYLEWLSGFASLFNEYLTPDGSIVIELGNSWVPGSPTMSTLSIEALLAFKKAGELHLCQEFIAFNTAKLPTPAQWVNIERFRVKDAFTRVWWMSPVERPKADNKSVLTEYSKSMKKLLKKGTYNPGKRPSEHDIGEESFLEDHGGAIPPNVIIPPVEDMLPELLEVLPIANTSAYDPYLNYCRDNDIEPHPARMPSRLAEFFIRFLTERGDVVMDPFAGSNVTGAVAQELGRNWIAIEANEEYASASKSRFSSVMERGEMESASPSS